MTTAFITHYNLQSEDPQNLPLFAGLRIPEASATYHFMNSIRNQKAEVYENDYNLPT
jgi:hypothetical protein